MLNKSKESNNRYTILIGTIVCLLASFFYVYDYFVQVAPSVMVGNLMRDFKTDSVGLGILSACFFYGYAGMQIPAGWLLDRFGVRKLLSAAILISAIGVILFSYSHVLLVAGFGRFLVGFGSAFSFVSALYLISCWFSHRYFSTCSGLVQLGACVGSIMGLAPISLLVNQYGWRETMLMTGVLTIALALIAWLVIRDGPHRVEKTQQTTPWADAKKLLRNKSLWIVCACGCLCWLPVGGIGALWGVPYLMGVYHITNTQAGNLVMWFWLGVGFGSPLIGWLSFKISRRRTPIMFCFFCALVASLLFLRAPHLSMMSISVVLFVLGFSASTQALTFGVLKDLIPQEQFGIGSGIINMSAIIGGGIAQPLIGFALRMGWHGGYAKGIPVYSVADYQHGLIVLPIVALLGLVVSCLALKETFCGTARLV